MSKTETKGNNLRYIQEEEEDPLNDSQTAYYHPPAIEENDRVVDDMGLTDSARMQMARAEKNGFKSV